MDIERYDARLAQAELNVIDSPVQRVREVFDLMPTESDDEWVTVAARMRAVPAALAGYRRSLLEAARQGAVAAQRQAERCATQCDRWAGVVGRDPFFTTLVDGSHRTGALRRDLTRPRERPRRRTPRWRRSSARRSPRLRRRSTLSARTATGWSRAPTSAPTSTRVKRTRGRGTSSLRSPTRWPSSPVGCGLVCRRRRPPSNSTATRPTRCAAKPSSATGYRSCPIPP